MWPNPIVMVPRNAFWDPEAVKTVFDSKIPLTMVALESTNNVPLTNDIRLSWAKNRRYIGLDFIGNSYAFVPELRDFPTNSKHPKGNRLS